MNTFKRVAMQRGTDVNRQVQEAEGGVSYVFLEGDNGVTWTIYLDSEGDLLVTMNDIARTLAIEPLTRGGIRLRAMGWRP